MNLLISEQQAVVEITDTNLGQSGAMKKTKKIYGTKAGNKGVNDIAAIVRPVNQVP